MKPATAAFIVVLALSGTLAVESDAARNKPIPVELWCGGDDGLTLRLRDAVEAAFKRSSDFSVSTGKRRPGTLIVTIPNHVEWTRADGPSERFLVHYTVEFSSVISKLISRTEDNCWDDEYAKCAGRILEEAKAAARKIRR